MKAKEQTQAALTASERWLAVVDSGDYAESWEQASGYLKKVVTREKFVQSLEAVLGPIGPLVARKVKLSKYRTSLPGAPDGEYVVIQYTSSFESKKKAVETVTPMLEPDGSWRVSGYYIK